MEAISRKKFNLGAVVEVGAKLLGLSAYPTVGELVAPRLDRYYGQNRELPMEALFISTNLLCELAAERPERG